ncbi:thymidylate kinase [Geminocystis sp. NIES-3708]|uniref:dTMP kinase n=1 Tax=Geminocystis sp. NIES-3708 TaxID=1615909 RepID=UPI0005FC8AD3|nr:dTMP kinase [Geminocystis sp. NIES-3708]BAQ60846.1 thymidylate kinase [Geminocystis sp. NIES-3708]
MIYQKKKQGYFIVLEGIDGAGSTTQANLLERYFINKQKKAIVSPEPSSGKIGKLLREFLAHQNNFINQDLFDQQMAYLFAADRHYHLYNNIDGVQKLIQENTHVITTRYYFSSLAYNAKTEKDFQFVSLLNRDFPPPDLLIYLDIPVDIALNRISNRAILEIYETKEKLTRVKENFERILSQYEYPYVKIDATKMKEVIHKEIVNSLERVR